MDIYNKKYIVFRNDSVLWDVMYGDWYNREDVFIIQRSSFPAVKLLHRTVFSTKVNRYINVPGKKHWINNSLYNCKFTTNDDIVVLLFDAAYEVYSFDVLDALKKRYKQIKFIYILENPYIGEVVIKYNKISQYITSVFTFDKKLAQEKGWIYYQFPYSGYKKSIEQFPESDLFFVGANKGRYESIIRVFEQAKEKNIKCDFHIIGVPKKIQKYPDEITYNDNVSYIDNLSGVMATKCLLEIVQGNFYHCTIRTLEALYYRKKLLTTNKDVFEYIDVNRKLVMIYDIESGILDDDFLNKEVSEDEFPSREDFSPNKLLEIIQRCV